VDLVETRRTAADAAVYVSNGSPAEFADAIEGLLADPARRARMRETALARFAETLAWEHQARRYVGVWDALFADRSATVALPEAEKSPEAA
jgi:glycosyltransferase involved in cell wall biosynthesis